MAARLPPGRELYAIGSNPEARAWPACVRTAACSTAFVISGALAGLAGVLFTARFGTVDATAGAATS